MSSLLSVRPQPPYGSVRQPSGQVFNLSWTLVENQYATIVHYIDRLYFRQLVGAGEIAVGRQRIALGTGRVWNPTDLFNPISPTSFTLAHNVESEAEVREVMAQAQRAGAKVAKPAQRAFWGGYAGYFHDPDGHLWEGAFNPDLSATQ